MESNSKFATELEHLRRELSEREKEARGLAERIASLQERIDVAVSHLDRATGKRERRPEAGTSKR